MYKQARTVSRKRRWKWTLLRAGGCAEKWIWVKEVSVDLKTARITVMSRATRLWLDNSRWPNEQLNAMMVGQNGILKSPHGMSSATTSIAMLRECVNVTVRLVHTSHDRAGGLYSICDLILHSDSNINRNWFKQNNARRKIHTNRFQFAHRQPNNIDFVQPTRVKN